MNPIPTAVTVDPLACRLPSARVLARMALLLDDAALHEPLPTPLDAAAAMAAGPGWFESSFELERGLQVLEGAPCGIDWDGLGGAWRRAC
ncbi:MAG: hypothetical protein ABIX46_13765 [Burkholderiaceae bacterium]